MTETEPTLDGLGHVRMPVLKAVRAKCLDCSGSSAAEAKACPVTSCPLFPFRLGSDPWRKRATLSDDEREKRTARLQSARSSREAILDGRAR